MFYPRFNRTKDAEAKSNIVSSKHNNVCYDVSQESISGKFDPTALERGAAALRYLDGSPHASKAFEITKLQELTKQAELKNEMEKLHSAQSKLQLERAQIEAQERRKTMMKQQEQERITAQYKAQLEAEAYAKKLRDQQDQNERCLRQQHEQFLRQENIRKQTENEILKAKLEHKRLETQHEKDLIKTKIHEETRGKILQERENVDIHFRELKLKASEQRQTQLESIKTTLSSLGKACTNLLEDKKKLTAMVTGFTGLALGIYGAKATTQVAGRYIESRLGKPSLIRETSRWTFHRNFKSMLFPWLVSPVQISNTLILPDTLNQRLQWVSNSLMMSRKYGVAFRHLLLYGPPGTGKTLFARTLAKESGLDYAIMSGGDAAPLNENAVHEINKVFRWAKKSPKGLILFIDEAEAFLRKGRGDLTNQGMSEDARNALSTFLHHTGTESTDFCLILATNEKDVLDKAILDRMDENFEFPLPEYNERLRMLKLFVEKHLKSPTKKGKKLEIDPDFNETFLEEIAEKTKGFTGRQLAKLILGMQTAMLGSGSTKLNKKLGQTVLQWSLTNNEASKTQVEKTTF